ncbi:MAG TPA: hypothetical protein VLF69_00830 [Candidatus Saccharimonadales bacterium]|nr:hypothetical protein [Candidatus Saccharimonadales bacterium]
MSDKERSYYIEHRTAVFNTVAEAEAASERNAQVWLERWRAQKNDSQNDGRIVDSFANGTDEIDLDSSHARAVKITRTMTTADGLRQVLNYDCTFAADQDTEGSLEITSPADHDPPESVIAAYEEVARFLFDRCMYLARQGHDGDRS